MVDILIMYYDNTYNICAELQLWFQFPQTHTMLL